MTGTNGTVGQEPGSEHYYFISPGLTWDMGSGTRVLKIFNEGKMDPKYV